MINLSVKNKCHILLVNSPHILRISQNRCFFVRCKNIEYVSLIKLDSFNIYKNDNITYIDSLPATQAYDELVDIIHHPQFKSEDVVPNSRRFRKYRQSLPLLLIKSRQINISSKKTPSTSKNIGEAYYLAKCTSDWVKKLQKTKSFGMEISGRNLRDSDKHLLQSIKVILNRN